MSIKQFIKHHYRHFNAATVIEAAEAYVNQLKNGGKMMVTLAGAMSTAELGLSLAEMIRQNKVHAITCTGANLEEDIFNLVAHPYYKRIPDWRNLTPQKEKELEQNCMNRVTDTCIPEEEAFRAVEKELIKIWKEADEKGERYFPHEFMYRLIREGLIKKKYTIDPKDSWLLAACEKNLPIFVPGWEDSTLGNVFAARVMTGIVKNVRTMKSGIEYMIALSNWYTQTTMGKDTMALDAQAVDSEAGYEAISAKEAKCTIGFFQIGGGIAGDFPICVVPMILQDLRKNCPYWNYFCQISDSTTSYGSYSGAIPTEKITWGKLDIATPKFIVESDATIVAPLMFQYILES